jgi:hypothetical protein
MLRRFSTDSFVSGHGFSRAIRYSAKRHTALPQAGAQAKPRASQGRGECASWGTCIDLTYWATALSSGSLVDFEIISSQILRSVSGNAAPAKIMARLSDGE